MAFINATIGPCKNFNFNFNFFCWDYIFFFFLRFYSGVHKCHYMLLYDLGLIVEFINTIIDRKYSEGQPIQIHKIIPTSLF